MGKEHIDSLEGFGNSLSSLILTSNSLMEKAVVDLRFFLQSYVFRRTFFFKIHLNSKQNISGEGGF